MGTDESGLHLGVPWEHDHLGRPAKRAGHPRSQQRTQAIENRCKLISHPGVQALGFMPNTLKAGTGL